MAEITMKRFPLKPHVFPLLFLSCLASLGVQAADISLGVNGMASVSPYKAKHTDYMALPSFNYDNDIWYIDGAEAGYYVLNDDTNELKLKMFYDGKSYDAGDGAMMRNLNDRRATLMTGASYQYTLPFGAVSTQVAADVLNHSKGITANLAYLNMLTCGAFTVVPELGVDWANAQQNRYYYGISSEEARRTNIATYRPGSAFTPYLSLTLDYQLTAHWEIYASARVDWLPSSVRSSPMVDRSETYSYGVGVKYNF